MGLITSRSSFPHFCRWVKITSTAEPFFSNAIEGSRVLYNFLAISADNVLPRPEFLAGTTRCFRPSAAMLTSLDTVLDAIAIKVPPLYIHEPLEAAIRGGNGKYVFSSDNEVLFFGDDVLAEGFVVL